MHISEMIDTRHEFTKLIKENLYGEGRKTEGQAALIARRHLDNFFFDPPEGALARGKPSDLAPLREAIIFETYEELLNILSHYSDRFGIKQGMQAILADPDVRDRFDEERQDKMRAIVSTSFSFLAKRRFDQLYHSIQAEVAPFFHSRDEATLKGAKLWSKERGRWPAGNGDTPPPAENRFDQRKVKQWRESFTAGANNTGNVSATVSGKLVLSWHGTPTQKDDALKMFPVIQQRMEPGVSLESFADAVIASLHDVGMAQDDVGRNIQTIAMLWRLFTTPVDHNDPGFTYGDLVAVRNFHVAFELHEQPNDQFKVTWTVNTMPGG